ncbi:SDR family NAD(P)-dependent oxidoreductase [Lutispora sp.]|jgi:NAD(P)-dependent dehydrogenase (short-subunit alcohol dehydrogenase family)|nr:SDR family oxidoreductase [Lutispora sp.]MEA4963318.1 SDR family oxidoreductase [Lutispora sp.]
MIKIDLTNKVALVTGAAGGLGKQICTDLAQCGADVVVAVNNSIAEAGKIAEDIKQMGRKAVVVHGNIACSKAVKRMVKEALDYFGRPVDILVNNAGYYKEYGNITEVTDEIIDRTIDTNLKGAFYMCREVGKAMASSGIKGRIINISSGAGHSGRTNHAHYCASKGGLLMLTKAAALDLAPMGINVNSVSVGFVDVGRFDEGDLLAVKRDILPRILLRKPGKPSDISNMVCYLASDCAEWITGSDFRIDGGEAAGRVPYEY